MAQLSAVITTNDSEFRAAIQQLLRSSGLPIGVADVKHFSNGSSADVAIVDIRSGTALALEGVERLRASWPSVAILAVADSAGPDQILQAMRAGANEFLAWSPSADDGTTCAEAFRAALNRTAERIGSTRDGKRSCVTLSFFGAKGGTGTTTFAVNSAVEIARLTKRPTLIIDLHQFLGEVSLFLGVRPRFTLVDAIDNLHRLDQEFLRELVVRHTSGLDILAGGDQIDRPGPQDAPAVEHLLRLLGRLYDFIILDAGAVTSPCAEVAVCAADTIYLVANPDVASIRNAHRLVDRIGQFGAGKDRLRILLNRMSDQHVIGPKQIEATLGHNIHLAFPSDYNTVSGALNSGVPLTLTNHSEMAAQFSRMIREIVQGPAQAEPADQSRARGPFLGLF